MADEKLYEDLKASGVSPADVWRRARKDGHAEIECFRLVRVVFGLSLGEAKDVRHEVSGGERSLSDQHADLAKVVEAALDEGDDGREGSG